MKRFRFLFSLFALAALVLPTLFSFNTTSVFANPNTSCELSWELVPAPSFPGKSPVLFGIAHSAANDVWAVGRLTEGQPSSYVYPPLFLHWDGLQWSQVAVPDFETEPYIDGITAISPTDAWAVGALSGESPQVVILHWNGSLWSRASVPQEWVGYLSGVGHASSNHVWAIGNNGKNPLLLFWDGIEWSNNSDQMAALGFTELDFIRVRGGEDVYVAGEMYEDDGGLYAAVAHWDGAEWQVIAKENIVDGSIPGSTTYQYIGGLVVLASDDIWMALGHAGISAFQPQYTFLRWQGESWETIGKGHGHPLDLAGSEPNHVYGLTFWQFYKGARYWDGTTWKEIEFPLPKGTLERYSRLGIISESEAWVIGEESNAPNKHQPYIAHGTSPCSVPPRPTLSSPNKNQIVQRTDPTLRWEFTPGANSFEVILRQMHTPDRPVTRENVTHAYFKPPMVLNRGESYKWRVRACNNNGCGRWSKTRKFTVSGSEQ